MSDNKSNNGRRKLLKSIAVGSGVVVGGKSLPESWSKPVIKSLVLPVHATTTESEAETLPVDTRCRIPAGCIQIYPNPVYITFAGGFEGDFFPPDPDVYADIDCENRHTGTGGTGVFVIARTAEDANAIFAENNRPNAGAETAGALEGPCQLWYPD